MELKQKEVVLGRDGRTILVSEAGWDYTFRLDEIEKLVAEQVKDSQDNTFKFFCNNYYPLMASCVVGEPPSAQEVYDLPRLYMDNWYLVVWELNEDIIGKPVFKQLESEEVKFRDGSSVYVYSANGLPSFVLKLVELENYALEHPFEKDPQGQMFHSVFYPKMVASCNGSDVPDALAVRNWPRSEISKWLDASRRRNPEWFVTSEPSEPEKKKKERKRSAG